MEKEPTIKDVLTELALFKEYFSHELKLGLDSLRDELVNKMHDEIQESATTLYSNIKYEMDARFFEMNEKIDGTKTDLDGVKNSLAHDFQELKDELRSFKIETRRSFRDLGEAIGMLGTKVYGDHEQRIVVLES